MFTGHSDMCYWPVPHSTDLGDGCVFPSRSPLVTKCGDGEILRGSEPCLGSP